MTEWRNVKLSDFIRIKHGYAFKGSDFSEDETPYILVTPGNFEIGGGFKKDKFKWYAGIIPEDYVLKRDDLIVTMTDLSKNGDSLGYSALVPEMRGKTFLHNQRIGFIQIKNTEIDKYFLYWLMRTKKYQRSIVNTASGSTVKHTSPDRICAYTFSLPPLDVQKRIAGILGALDDRIDVLRRENVVLEQMAQAVFQSWFVDFDIVRAKAAGTPESEVCEKYHITPELYALFPSALTPDNLPLGWEKKSLPEIATYLNGLPLQKFPPKNEDEFLPVIKIAELKARSVVGADKASTDIDSKYIIDDGDVIFSWSGSLAVDIWCCGKGALNQHLFKVFSSDYPKWFYYLWTKSYLFQFQQIAAGKATTMGHIQRAHLEEAKANVPSEKILEVTDKIISPLIEKIIENSKQIRALSATRDALLPKLMNGEIEV